MPDGAGNNAPIHPFTRTGTLMRNRIHVVVAAVLFIAGIVCFAESQVLAGNVLVVAAGLAYAAGIAVRVSHQRTAVALSSDDDRTSL